MSSYKCLRSLTPSLWQRSHPLPRQSLFSGAITRCYLNGGWPSGMNEVERSWTWARDEAGPTDGAEISQAQPISSSHWLSSLSVNPLYFLSQSILQWNYSTTQLYPSLYGFYVLYTFVFLVYNILLRCQSVPLGDQYSINLQYICSSAIKYNKKAYKRERERERERECNLGHGLIRIIYEVTALFALISKEAQSRVVVFDVSCWVI